MARSGFYEDANPTPTAQQSILDQVNTAAAAAEAAAAQAEDTLADAALAEANAANSAIAAGAAVAGSLRRNNNLADIGDPSEALANLGLDSTTAPTLLGLGVYAQAAKGQLPGTSTNDNASTGNIGEYKSCSNNALNHTGTISIASPGVVTYIDSANILGIGSAVNFTTTGALPTGLVVGTTYYVCSTSFVQGVSFTVSATVADALAGIAINTTGTQSGTHTVCGQAIGVSGFTAQTLAALSLTAGDWDVCGNASTLMAGTTVMTRFDAGISTTLASYQGGAPFSGAKSTWQGSVTGLNIAMQTGTLRVSTGSTITVYLMANAVFTTSTCGLFGFIQARRVR